MNQKKPQLLAGWMMIALIVVGILGILGAILAMINEYDYVGMGLCLLAAAYSFGSVVKAFR
ncbi:MAG: hypothetical protein P8046_15335 [Anaerolineales bacterium]|jgi:hypothetical protein